jgi:predicted naringenin-chalcone synthase
MQMLLKMLRHPGVNERRSAVWGLGVCGSASMVSRLEFMTRSDPDERVRELAASACRQIQNRSEKPSGSA